jgi:hypothetical protein
MPILSRKASSDQQLLSRVLQIYDISVLLHHVSLASGEPCYGTINFIIELNESIYLRISGEAIQEEFYITLIITNVIPIKQSRVHSLQ